MNSLDDGATVGMSYKALQKYRSSMSWCMPCSPWCSRHIFGTFISFIDPTSTIQILCKRWWSQWRMVVEWMLLRLFRGSLSFSSDWSCLFKYLVADKCLSMYVSEAQDCMVVIFFRVFVARPKKYLHAQKL